jgi:hypothetical protein
MILLLYNSNVEVKLSLFSTKYCGMKITLCLPKYNAMKTYGRVEVQFHAFLT